MIVNWIYFPFALLLVIVLISAVTLSPTYGELLCPFGAMQSFTNKANNIDIRVRLKNK